MKREIKQISPSVYVRTGYRGANLGLITTGDGTVLIDAPNKPSEAEEWLKLVASKGEVRYLINTESHIDHTLGAFLLPGTLVAQEETRTEILARSANDLVNWVKKNDPAGLPLMAKCQIRAPSIIFSERLTFHLGKQTIELIHLPGHTLGQTAVYLPQEKVLFTGDNITYKVQVFLHEGDPFQWLKSLAVIALMDVDIIVPGHGLLCDRSAIPEISSFIREWIDTIRKAIKDGVSKEEAMKKISFADRYPWPPELDPMGPEFMRKGVAKLYDLLSRKPEH